MKNRFSSLITLIALTAFAVGCGASYRGMVDSDSDNDLGWQWPDPSNPTDPSNPDGGNSDIGDALPLTYRVAGSNFTSRATAPVVVETDDTLRVRVDASNLEILAGSSSAPRPVGCVKVSVTVNGLTRTTGVLKTGENFGFAYYGGKSNYQTTPPVNPLVDSSGPYYTGLAAANLCCANAGSSETLDFSSHIRNRGNAPVEIRVSNVSYSREDRSYLYWGIRCGSLASIFSNHVVSGEIQVETDYTGPLN